MNDVLPTDETTITAPRWRIKPLVTYHVLAGVLAGTWLLPPTRVVWDALDRAGFYALNGTLQWGHAWQSYWAMANERWFDALSAVIMIGVLACYVFRGNYEQAARRLAEATYLGLSMLLIVGVTREYLFSPMARDSPSLVLEPFYNLRELLGTSTKVFSTDSFPGDHGTVTLTYTFMLWRLAGWRFGLIGLGFAMMFTLPRLIGGAHWLTDVLIGGGCIALIGTSWMCFTPIYKHGLQLITNIYAGIGKIGERLCGKRDR